MNLESDRGRRWMQYTFRQQGHPVQRKTARIKFSVSDELLQQCKEEVTKLNDAGIAIAAINTQNITITINAEKQGWTVCGASSLCGQDISHEEPHVMCVSCRVWLHEMCANKKCRDVTYFICDSCTQKEWHISTFNIITA